MHVLLRPSSSNVGLWGNHEARSIQQVDSTGLYNKDHADKTKDALATCIRQYLSLAVSATYKSVSTDLPDSVL